MEKLGFNLIKYTIGFPMMIIVSIWRLFIIFLSIVTNDAFVVYRWIQIIRMWKPYTFENTK